MLAGAVDDVVSVDRSALSYLWQTSRCPAPASGGGARLACRVGCLRIDPG